MPQTQSMGQNTGSKADFGNSLDLVDIKEIRDNVVIMKDGSLKQIVMVGGVNFALKSDTEQTIITQGYQNLLNGVDFPLQIIVHSRKVNIDRYIQTLIARKDIEESPLLKSQIDEYVEFVKGFVQKNAIMEKTFLVVVPFYPIGLGLGKKSGAFSFFGGGKKAVPKATSGANAPALAKNPETEKDFQENLAQLGQRSGQIISELSNIGLEATLLENDALIELFYNFYNPQTVERENITVPTDDGQSK
jgi:type IV secretory pathway VirB4 component